MNATAQTTRLIGYKVFRGTITVKTGLHIGGGGSEVQIGGMDNPVILHPVTQHPYIPGSSLKGKLRAILEWKHRAFDNDGGPSKDPRSIPAQIFGCADVNKAETVTRLLVEDAYVCNAEQWQGGFTEEKAETAINRITGEAKSGTLRSTERVVPGVSFAFRMSLRVFEGDPTETYVRELEDALRILRDHEGLGGSTSRGYGRVDITWEVKDEPAIP